MIVLMGMGQVRLSDAETDRLVINCPRIAFGSAGRRVFGSASGSSAAIALAARRIVGSSGSWSLA
jgi:hypothetical protein